MSEGARKGVSERAREREVSTAHKKKVEMIKRRALENCKPRDQVGGDFPAPARP